MLSRESYDPLKIDIWSLGIVLYTMCFGYLPFDSTESAELFKIIREGKYELPDHCSEDLASLLKIIIEVDPLKRATIEQIRRHIFCGGNRVPVVFGIIQGLSTIPYEEHI
jgi:5'-AMP-activated protein kinase catalytic alpha subunit